MPKTTITYDGENIVDAEQPVKVTMKTQGLVMLTDVVVRSELGSITIDPSDSDPIMDGQANPGVSSEYSRGDHVHPSDTSKQDVLVLDSEPTRNSSNFLTSGSVYDAQSRITDNTDRLYLHKLGYSPYQIVKANIDGKLVAATDTSVQYVTQRLSDAEKTRARANIDAASVDQLAIVLKYRGDVSTAAQLPDSDNQVGDTYHVQATDSLYVWITTQEHQSGYWKEFTSSSSGGVVSVNGQTGVVELDAADVGADVFTVEYEEDPADTWTMITTMADLTAAREAGRSIQLRATSISLESIVYTTLSDYTYALMFTNVVPNYVDNAVTGVRLDYFGFALADTSAVVTGSKSLALSSDIPNVPTAYTSSPEMDGTASAGSSTAWAKGDHVHPSDTAKANKPAEVTVTTAGAVSQECADNTIYTFTGALTSLTLTQAAGAREYIVIFTTGSTAPTVTPPTGVIFPDGTNTFIAEANKRYEISVRDGYALDGSWEMS